MAFTVTILYLNTIEYLWDVVKWDFLVMYVWLTTVHCCHLNMFQNP